MEKKDDLILRDWLAVERTKLANERTFLAYFRSSLVIFVSGISVLKLEVFADLKILAYTMLVIAPLLLLFGIYRVVKVRRWIREHY